VIGNALEQEIMGLYNGEISAMYSINQIAALLNKKYPYINKKVTSLINQEIFKMTIVGRSHLCSLNLKNEETIIILILNEIKRKKAELRKNKSLYKLIDYIEKLSRTAFISVALKKDNTLILVSENTDKFDSIRKGIPKQIFNECKIELLVKDDFLKLLLKDKSFYQSRIILYGFEKYYEYVRAVEDELKLKYSKLIP